MTPERLQTLTHASRVLDEILNRAPNRQAPYVGEAAFATKAGIHASAILKEPATYEHVRAGERRQPPPRAGVRPGRQVEPGATSLERLGIPSGKDDARHRPAARGGEGARGRWLRL